VKVAGIILIGCAVVIGALIQFDIFGSDPVGETEERGAYVVRRSPLRITLTERGTLKTKNATKIRPETGAKIEWIVDEGKDVKKDEVLVELDKEETTRRVEQFANQVIQLEAELKSAKTEVIVQEGQNKTDVEKAGLGLEVAKVELKKLLESDIPSEERKKILRIEEAKTSLKRAKDQVEASKQLLEEDFVTPNEHEETVLALKKAENELETAEMDWKAYLEYQKPLDIRKRKSAVTEAERGLERAKQRAEAQISAKRARAQQKEISLARVKSQLEREEKKLKQMTLKAPTDGTVIYGDSDQPWAAENVKVGQQVWPNMTLITLPDPSEMAVIIQVHEADIDKIKTGMPAFITSETQKGRVYEGEISKIDAVANAGRRRWGGDGVKRFKVEISLRGKDLSLKTGTSAKAEVLVEETAPILQVPTQAVQVKDGKYFCYRVKNGRNEKVTVEPGRSSDTYAEIKSGLEEGDAVLLYDPEQAEEAEEEEGGKSPRSPSKP
jgi:HlyD family secretion protein